MEIDLWLHAGFDVVANGSRAHLALARERYGEVLVPILSRRLAAGAAPAAGAARPENTLEIAQRLERAARYKPDNCLTLNNDGSLRQSVDEFFRLLRSHAAREADQLV